MKHPKYNGKLCDWKCPYLMGNVKVSKCTGQLENDVVHLVQSEAGEALRCDRCLERYTEEEPDGIKTMFEFIRSDMKVLAGKLEERGFPHESQRLDEMSEEELWELQQTVLE